MNGLDEPLAAPAEVNWASGHSAAHIITIISEPATGGEPQADPEDQRGADGEQAQHEQGVRPPGAGDGVEEGLERADLDAGSGSPWSASRR